MHIAPEVDWGDRGASLGAGQGDGAPVEPPVSEADISFYREHGWWVSEPILPDALLDDLAYAIDRYAAGERDRPLPRPVLPAWTGDVARGLRQADYVSLQMDAAMVFVRDPLLPRIASALSGAAEIRLFHDQLVCKLPGQAGPPANVGWHTDRAYWRTCTSERMLTAWVPLQDTPQEMGPLAVWDASHRWDGTETLHNFDDPDLDALEVALRPGKGEPAIRILEMRRGQVSFHHCRLIHGSYGNRTDRPRLGFAIHYQDGSNRHTGAATGPGCPVHINDLLCRRDSSGRPDYSDPEICPRLYPASDESMIASD